MENLNSIPFEFYGARFAVVTACCLVLYNLALVVRRLFFSPIAGFPGPKIAAATGWYEFYHDYFRNGTYLFRIKEMHDKYGSSRT